MVPRPIRSQSSSPPIAIFGTALSVPLWRVVLAAILIMLYAIAVADVSPASASGKVYRVPSRIDATGSRDVSRELNSFIASVPNGSVIRFESGGTYRLSRTMYISGKRHLTLNGNGARLHLTGASGWNAMGIQVKRSVGTTIRNFTIVGNNHEAGTSDACCSRETQHAIALLSAKDTLIEKVHIRRTWGDCLYLNAATVPGGSWSHGVTFRRSTCRLTGRHGVGIIRARNVRILNNRFDEIGFMVIDIEPGARDAGARTVVIRGNNIGSYGIGDFDNAWLLAACGKRGAPVRDVALTANTIKGNRIGWSGSVTRPWRALSVRVCGRDGPRANFTITNNVAKAKVTGPSMHFSRVTGLTITGNEQPLRSGRLASIRNSSQVTFRP